MCILAGQQRSRNSMRQYMMCIYRHAHMQPDVVPGRKPRLEPVILKWHAPTKFRATDAARASTWGFAGESPEASASVYIYGMCATCPLITKCHSTWAAPGTASLTNSCMGAG